MNKKERQVYWELFCELNDLFSPFYWTEELNCPQKQFMEHFARCYWENYRNGNGNVDNGSAPHYLEHIRQVGYVLLWDATLYKPPFKTHKEIFNEQECQKIREDLAVIELIYILSMCSGAEFITDEEWSEIMKVLTHNSPARNSYKSLMPRVVDWCRANPVLTCRDSEGEKEVAENYRLLVSRQLTS